MISFIDIRKSFMFKEKRLKVGVKIIDSFFLYHGCVLLVVIQGLNKGYKLI